MAFCHFVFSVALCCVYLWEEAGPVLKIAGNSHFLRSEKYIIM